MNRHRRHLLISAAPIALGGIAAAGCSSLGPQSAPAVKLVIPFAAGGSTDSVARLLAAALTESTGRPWAVENRGGSDGIPAAQAVMQAAPDGGTLLLATASGFSGAPVLRRNFPFDPLVDFTPVGLLGTYAFFLLAHPSLPARTVPELLAHVRAHPAAVRCGNATATARIALAQLARGAGLQLHTTELAGDAALAGELLAGRVQLALAAGGLFVPHVLAGRLHALAAMLRERSPLLPQVPTFAQSGLAAPVTPWGALFGPKGMSGTVVAGLNGEVAAVLRGPALRQRLSDLAFEPRTSSADELARMAADQLSAWRRAAAEAGMSPA